MAEDQSLKDKVEERLQNQQASKEFKDIGRVQQTRKEMAAYKLITGSVLDQLEQDSVMAYNMVKKENVWPEIDIKAEKEKGVNSGAAYLKVKIREGVPTRPKDDKNKRASYVTFLELLQSDLTGCFTVKDIEELTKKYENLSFNEIIGYFIEPTFFNETPERKAEIQERLSKVFNRYSSGSGTNFRYLVEKVVEEIFGKRFLNILFKKNYKSDAVSNTYQEAKDKEPITEEESKVLIDALKERERKFIFANEKTIQEYKDYNISELMMSMKNKWTPGVYKTYKNTPEDFRKWAINYYERKINNEKEVFAKKEALYAPRGNDWSWFESPDPKEVVDGTVKKPRSESINTKSPLDYIKRTGGYKIEELTAQQIIDKFGFSAVNYGNYVNDTWSKEHTKHFLGAISDMAEMFNINVKQMNELGKLGIAFGAKGRPGHMATYFPQTKDINLTKNNGDGSVCHEWGHYFDNVIVELDVKKATNEFASDGDMPDYKIKSLYRQLMDFINKGDKIHTPKVPMTFYAKEYDAPPKYPYKREQYYGWQYAKVEIKDTIEETLAQYEHLAVVDENFYSYQLNVFGYIIYKFGLKTYKVPMTLQTSYYYHSSAYMSFKYCWTMDGKIKVSAFKRTPYWGSNTELFARAWETVVNKKLMDAGRVSNYLVNGIPTEVIISQNYFRPYPIGSELAYIESLIDLIIEAVKEKFAISGFVPPSDIIENEYIDLTKDDSGKIDTGMVVEEKPSGKKVIEFIDKDKIVDVVEENPVAEAKIAEMAVNNLSTIPIVRQGYYASGFGGKYETVTFIEPIEIEGYKWFVYKDQFNQFGVAEDRTGATAAGRYDNKEEAIKETIERINAHKDQLSKALESHVLSPRYDINSLPLEESQVIVINKMIADKDFRKLIKLLSVKDNKISRNIYSNISGFSIKSNTTNKEIIEHFKDKYGYDLDADIAEKEDTRKALEKEAKVQAVNAKKDKYPFLDLTDVTPIEMGRIEKYLEQKFNFRGEGVMTMAENLAKHHKDFVRKYIYHEKSNSKGQLRETPLNIYELQDINGYIKDIPKIIYDTFIIDPSVKERAMEGYKKERDKAIDGELLMTSSGEYTSYREQLKNEFENGKINDWQLSDSELTDKSGVMTDSSFRNQAFHIHQALIAGLPVPEKVLVNYGKLRESKFVPKTEEFPYVSDDFQIGHEGAYENTEPVEELKAKSFTYDIDGNVVECEVLSKGRTTSSVLINGKQTVRANTEIFSSIEDEKERKSKEQPELYNFKRGDRVQLLIDKGGVKGTVKWAAKKFPDDKFQTVIILWDGESQPTTEKQNDIELITDEVKDISGLVFYTNAPEDYDGFGTQVIELTDWYDTKGRQLRKVDIKEKNVIWQKQRYNSGMYLCLDEKELAEAIKVELIKKGKIENSPFEELESFNSLNNGDRVKLVGRGDVKGTIQSKPKSATENWVIVLWDGEEQPSDYHYKATQLEVIPKNDNIKTNAQLNQIKKDFLFLIGLQRDKENKKPNGWDINLFKSSFYNKMNKLSDDDRLDIFEYMEATEGNFKNRSPVFTKNHKIWDLKPKSEDIEEPVIEADPADERQEIEKAIKGLELIVKYGSKEEANEASKAIAGFLVALKYL